MTGPRKSPALAGKPGLVVNHFKHEHYTTLAMGTAVARTDSGMGTEKLLSRLEGVRATAPDRWVAKCPAHKDRYPSLSVRAIDGDRVLIHCFAGCGAADVLAAVGLTMADLFPSKHDHYLPPSRSRIPARDLLDLIAFEAEVIHIVGADMRANRNISEADFERLASAVHRIRQARNYAHG